MQQKFFADAMLGKLARWLRLLGFDTLYFPSILDSELIKRAKKEDRIILSMDGDLIQELEPGQYFFFIDPETDLQLKHIISQLNLDPWKRLFSRCVHCNEEVEKVRDKSQIKGKVPSYAFKTSVSFYHCPVCGRIYWEGSHHRRIKEHLQILLEGI